MEGLRDAQFRHTSALFWVGAESAESQQQCGFGLVGEGPRQAVIRVALGSEKRSLCLINNNIVNFSKPTTVHGRLRNKRSKGVNFVGLAFRLLNY